MEFYHSEGAHPAFAANCSCPKQTNIFLSSPEGKETSLWIEGILNENYAEKLTVPRKLATVPYEHA